MSTAAVVQGRIAPRPLLVGAAACGRTCPPPAPTAAHHGHCCQAVGRTTSRSFLGAQLLFSLRSRLLMHPIPAFLTPSGWCLYLIKLLPKAEFLSFWKSSVPPEMWAGTSAQTELEGPAGPPSPTLRPPPAFRKEPGEPLLVHGPKCARSCFQSQPPNSPYSAAPVPQAADFPLQQEESTEAHRRYMFPAALVLLKNFCTKKENWLKRPQTTTNSKVIRGLSIEFNEQRQ